MAVQLARHAGATVIAQIRRDTHTDMMREAGAMQVIVDESGKEIGVNGPYHLAVDAVGGSVLTAALSALGPGGTCVQYGASSESGRYPSIVVTSSGTGHTPFTGCTSSPS